MLRSASAGLQRRRKTVKPNKKRVAEVLALLDREYGTDTRCYLHFGADHELLIAVMLSAQCTDARVNLVTPALFREFPTVDAFAEAKIEDLERAIHSVGFYHDKARNIKACMTRLRDVYGGKMPDTMEDLLTLPGVGRKTANVILGNLFDKPSVVVDTHVKRISAKLGFTGNTDPEKVEYDLMKVLPEDHWILYNMQIITLGRTICTARKPDCAGCFLREVCPAGNPDVKP
ncbi:MAG: endonuclease III [Lachnospiraceae bacterium]|nr:endonuclease III [Lachnospiraceae bacterium]